MDRKDSLAPKEKKITNRTVATISILAAVVLLVVDLFVMIRMPENNLAPVIITILMLVGVYLFVNAILKEIHENKKQEEEQYDMMFKSGKASYLLMKKALGQLNEIERNTTTPADDLIAAQKAIAKLTITRNKENAVALMNSNDELLGHILEFEERIKESQNELMEKNHDMFDASVNDILEKQKEILSNIQDMQNSIYGELSQTADNIHGNLTQTMESMQGIKDELVQQNVQMKEDLLAATLQLRQNISTEESIADAQPGAEELPIMEEAINFADNLGEMGAEAGIREEALDFADSLGEMGAEAGISAGEPDFADSLGETEKIEIADDFEEPEGEEDLSFLDNLNLEEELEAKEGELDFADSLGETEKIEIADDFEEPEEKEDLSFLDNLNLEEELEAKEEELDFADSLGEIELEEGENDFTEGLGEIEKIEISDDFEETGSEEDLSFLDNLNLDEELDKGLTETDGIDFAETLDFGEEDNLGLGEEETLDFGEEETFELGESDNILDFGKGESFNFGEEDNLGLGEEEALNFGEEDNLGLALEEVDSDESEISIDAFDTAEEPAANSNIIPMTVPEPVAKEEPAKAEASDPHKLMTPEEIAALIANM